jgi:hypothetical protein
MASTAIAGLSCELGTFTGSGLVLDNFKHEIQDYLVADWLVKVHFTKSFEFLGKATSPVDEEGNDLPGASTSQLTRYQFKPGQVEEVRLEFKQGLKAGDRVLAVPVNGGREAVIICKVVS